jgi:hypothetical protein
MLETGGRDLVFWLIKVEKHERGENGEAITEKWSFRLCYNER